MISCLPVALQRWLFTVVKAKCDTYLYGIIFCKFPNSMIDEDDVFEMKMMLSFMTVRGWATIHGWKNTINISN